MLIALYDRYASRTIAAAVAVIALCAFAYCGLLLGAVSHAAAAAAAEEGLQSLSAEVSGLESEFLAKTKELTPARAAMLGFVRPVTATTVFAGGHSLVLR